MRVLARTRCGHAQPGTTWSGRAQPGVAMCGLAQPDRNPNDSTKAPYDTAGTYGHLRDPARPGATLRDTTKAPHTIAGTYGRLRGPARSRAILRGTARHDRSPCGNLWALARHCAALRGPTRSSARCYDPMEVRPNADMTQAAHIKTFEPRATAGILGTVLQPMCHTVGYGMDDSA